MTPEWRKQGVPAARKPIQELDYEKSEHPLLTLQRYLKRHKPKERSNQDTMPEEALLEAIQQMQSSHAYKVAFCRWYQFATAKPSKRTREHFTMTTAAPLAIGLGNASPLEVGLTLHHTYGMPIIPGSALKGLCRRGALQLMREGKLSQEQFNTLFGTGGDKDAAAGAVVFYDAWFVPESVEGMPFHRDVITVHHPEYYGSRGAKPPTDFDDPNPVPFLVVKPGAQFLFVLDAPSSPWASFAEKLLRWCLAHLGVGAKTNAGYGYFASQRTDSAPQGGFQTTQEVWKNTKITWDPGKQEIRATNPASPSQSASAQGKEAQSLLGHLPEDTVARLKEKRGLQADVHIERIGNLLKIVRIDPLS